MKRRLRFDQLDGDIIEILVGFDHCRVTLFLENTKAVAKAKASRRLGLHVEA
jgi:hypothetical protein